MPVLVLNDIMQTSGAVSAATAIVDVCASLPESRRAPDALYRHPAAGNRRQAPGAKRPGHFPNLPAAMTHEEFELAYTKYAPRLKHTLMGKGVSQDEAEDIAQAAWVRAWEQRHQWRRDSLLQTWVHTIAWNDLRVRMRRPSSVLRSLDPVPDVPCGESSTSAVMQREVRDAVAKLNRLYRIPLVLWAEGKSGTEIMGHVGAASVATVKTRIHRGIKQVSEAMA